MSEYIKQNKHKVFCSFDNSESWVILSAIEQRIKKKVESVGIPLKDWDISIYRGVLTGYNEAFIISGEKKDELIAQDPKSAEIIRPILRGRDIKRYGYEFADLWLIATFPSKKYDIEDYPAVKEYLLSIGKERLEQTGKTHQINGIEVKARKKTTNKWFETQDSIGYWEEFSKQKIVYREISDAMNACLVGKDIMINNKCYMVTGTHLIYLLSIFNSRLFTKIMFQQANITGGKGEEFLSAISIPIPDIVIEHQLEELYSMRSGMLPKAQSQINDKVDRLICSLFALNQEEINYIMA